MPTRTEAAPALQFSGYQKIVIAMLAFLQFAVIIDFMLMAPLGALIMPALGATPAQFGTVVSAYAFAAGISGFLTAGFADRFDRKKLLLFFYAGFIAGTAWCGLATSFESLLLARIVRCAPVPEQGDESEACSTTPSIGYRRSGRCRSCCKARSSLLRSLSCRWSSGSSGCSRSRYS